MKQWKNATIFTVVIAAVLFSQTLWAGNTPEETKNIALTKKLVDEAWNKVNPKVLDEIIDPNCVFYINGELRDKIGPEFMRWTIERNAADLPGFKLTVKDIIAKGEKVVLIYKFEGVFKKLRKPVITEAVLVFIFKNGKVVKNWTYSNQLSFLQQLGFKVTPPANLQMKPEAEKAPAKK